MHYMMAKALTIWSKETGIDRNPADQIEVRRPDDARDRYLSENELRRLKQALEEKETCKLVALLPELEKRLEENKKTS